MNITASALWQDSRIHVRRAFVSVLVLLLLLAGLVIPLISPAPAQAQATSGTGRCGAHVALVVDLSRTTVGMQGNHATSKISGIQNALNTLVNTYADKPVSLGIYTFATESPAGGNQNFTSESMMAAASQGKIRSYINGLQLAPAGLQAATNWEGGLQRVLTDMENGTRYQNVYLITDSMPNQNETGSSGIATSTTEADLTRARDVAEQIHQLGAVVDGIGATQRFHNGHTVVVQMPDGQRQTRTYEDALSMITTNNNISNTSTYQQLASHIQQQVQLPAASSGCLTIENAIVDGEGKQLSAGGDWNFDLEVISGSATFPGGRQVSLQTNPGGNIETQLNELSQSARISIKSTPQQGYQIHPAGNTAARCFADGSGQPIPVDTVSGDPDSISVSVDLSTAVTCRFEHRPLIPVQLQKQVDVSTPQLQQELNNLNYGFTYTCIDADETTTLIPPTEASISVSERHDIGSIPLGASCVITETVHNRDPDRFDATTSWQANDADGNVSATSALTFTVTPTQNAYFSGAPVVVTALNSFQAFEGRIAISSIIPNEDALPQGRIPASVPIRYFCRYVPDPNNPPEQGGEGAANPYHVADGYTSIPRGGVAEIGPFPAGTQCGFEQTSPSTSTESPLIPGFSMTTTWNSDICLAPGPSDSLVPCEANFFWLPTAGSHEVQVSNSYTRQTTTLEVTQRLTGDAAARGAGQDMTVNVRCVDEGTEVFNEDVSVLPDLPTVVRGVPVASTCSVATTEMTIPGVTMDATESHMDVDSTDSYRMEITSALTALMGDVWLTKKVDITALTGSINAQNDSEVAEATMDLAELFAQEDPASDEDRTQALETLEEVMDAEGLTAQEETLQMLEEVERSVTGDPDNAVEPDVLDLLNDLITLVELPAQTSEFDPQSLLTVRYPVEARCLIPGQAEAQVWRGTVSHEESVLIGSYPVGTTCSFRETYEAPAGLDHHPTFDPPQITVQETDNDVELRNRFNVENSGLMLHYDVVTSENIPDWESIWDKNLYADLRCGTEALGQINLGDPAGHMELINKTFPAGTECTFSFDNSQVEKDGLATRVTTWNSPNSAGAMTTGTFGTSDQVQQLTVVMPENLDNNRLIINFHHEFTPVRSEILIDKSIIFDRPEGSDFNMDLAGAVIPDNHAVFVNYLCTRGETQLLRGAAVFTLGDSASINAPVGTECVLTPGERILVGAELMEIAASGDGIWESTPVERIVIDHATATPKTVDISNRYQLQLGGFNLKKKVDGEGVATIHSDRKYTVSYECTLNDKKVAEGTVEIGRFDSGQDFSATDIIVGSTCAVEEDPEEAREEHASWKARWSVAQGVTGWEQEDFCSPDGGQSGNCRSAEDPENHHQVMFTVDEVPGAGPAEHFQGTLVVWNTIHYNKARVKVEQQLEADGYELAATRDFEFNLVCTDPNYTGDLVDLDYVPDPTIRQAMTITGAGDVIAPKLVPVNYECTLVQAGIAPFDAVVSVSFEGAAREQDADPGSGLLAIAKFFIEPEFSVPDPDGTGDIGEPAPREVRVQTNYQRIRTEVAVESRLGEWPGQVDSYLTAGQSTVIWRCVDPYTDAVHEGEISVTPGGEPVLINDGGRNLPASVTCSFEETRSVTYPEGFEDVISDNSLVQVFWGDKTDPSRTEYRSDIGDVELSPQRTRVKFTNYYWVEQITLGVNKIVEGDPENRVFSPGELFGFQARCTIENILPGQTIAVDEESSVTQQSNELEIDFTLAHGDGWYTQSLPKGSNCKFTETFSDDQVRNLDALGVRVAQTYSTTEGESNTGDSARVEVNDSVEVNDELRDILFFNSIYRTDGEVQVWKVNGDGSPLEGARFALYEAVKPTTENPRGEPAATPLIEEMGFAPHFDEEGNIRLDGDGLPLSDPTRFVARLKPGSYFLVETRSGTGSELLPAPWQFSVVSADEGELGDLAFTLSTLDEHGGLITIVNPEKAGTEPSIIKVANVESGELPMTGGIGIWVMLGAGGGLLLLALLSWFGAHRRRG